MRALTVLSGRAGSAAITDVAEPAARDGALLVRVLGVGVCGTDVEIVRGDYGTARAARPLRRSARTQAGRREIDFGPPA